MEHSTEKFLDKIQKIYNLHFKEGSTTISKESTLEANAEGNSEQLKIADDIV
jgi:hypothetical protein